MLGIESSKGGVSTLTQGCSFNWKIFAENINFDRQLCQVNFSCKVKAMLCLLVRICLEPSVL